MPTFRLPEPFVGGPAADLVRAPKDLEARLDAIQRNFEELKNFLSEFAGRFYWGTGSPETVVYADQGSIFLRRDGGAATTAYVKTTDITLNTGWTALS